jgi:phosphatidylglycerol lysyltransferase
VDFKSSDAERDGVEESDPMSPSTPGSDAMLSPAASENVLQFSGLNESPTALRRSSWGIFLLAWLVRLSALINLLSSVLPERPRLVHWLGPWMPFEISEGIRLRIFLTSLLLFILASGLAKGKRTVWLLTMATLAIAPISHWGHVVIWPQMLINLGLIVFLLLHHRYFVVKSDRRSVRSALIICSVLGLTLLTLGTIRLHLLVDETSGGDDWGSCLQAAFELVVAQNAHAQEPQTDTASNSFRVLRIGGLTIGLLGLFLAMRPVLVKERAQAKDRLKVKRLIEQYGEDPFDAYALLEDKSYFFNDNATAAIPYVVSGNCAVALANPIGHPARRAQAIFDFVSFCQEQDWEPIFYAITDELLPGYQQAGLSVFKIGEGARLKTGKFELKGHGFQNLRTIRNRAVRLGMQFRWYDATQGVDDSLEQQLAAISHRWLEQKHAREMSFDMGSFSIEDIRRNGESPRFCDLAAVRAWPGPSARFDAGASPRA